MENIHSGAVYQALASQKCPDCGTALAIRLENGLDFWRSKDVLEEFQVGFCKLCGVGFSYPYLDLAALTPYYSHSYGPIQVETGLKRKIVTWKYRREIAAMKGRLGSRSNIFEIGAGNGAFLGELSHLGHTTRGLELAQSAVEGARETYGVELECGVIEGYRFKAKYQLVILRQVLEHLCDPTAIIREIFENGLEKGGWIYIKIPCQDSWERRVFGRFWNGWDLPRHRTHYSQSGMKKFLEGVGYCDVSVRSELLPNDVVHSLDWMTEFSSGPVKLLLSAVWKPLPWLLKTVIGQLTAMLLSPLGPGRMTVWARKPYNDPT